MNSKVKFGLQALLSQLALQDYAAYIYNVYIKNFDLAQIRNHKSITDEYSKRGLPIPPMYLIWLVIGNPDATIFLQSGSNQVENLLLPMLEKNNVNFNKRGTVLDFGCGCGRMLRFLRDFENLDLWGCDYNPKLIRWCKENLHFAQFKTNNFNPPLPFEPNSFDFIYARSIFTHFSEDAQFAWLKEINRVLRPNGHFWFTLSGDYYKQYMSPEELSRYDDGRIVTRNDLQEGKNGCAVFHPETYVKTTWPRFGFEIIDHVVGASVDLAWQDSYLCKKVNE